MKQSKGESSPHRSRRLEHFPFVDLRSLRKAAIVGHRHADPDAFCSAYGLASLLRLLNRQIKISISAPQGFSKLTKRLMEKYPATISKQPDFTKLDAIFIVDTGSAELLTEWLSSIRESNAKKIVIDHHPLTQGIEDLSDYRIVDQTSSSASEIVASLYLAKGLIPSKRVARALLSGILFDSQHLSIAKSSTIHVVSNLCKSGVSLEAIREDLFMPRDTSETTARMKAVQRLVNYRSGKWLLGSTRIGSFQASAARAIISVGANIASAYGEVNGESRCCLRATQSFYAETQIHLGSDIASPVAQSLGGVGGGHPTAASISTPAQLDYLADSVQRQLSSKLGSELKKII
ncbi:MAG: hypothetical protein CMO12_02430 [Thaumarchaeota archaeon]|nr:hypothetical protein [Nitrososphaerota archaeon]